jgi:hypothetical protein
MAYQLPVQVQTHTIASHGINIDYPIVWETANPRVNEQINRAITELVHVMIQEQKKYQTGSLTEMTGHYEIKTNERGLLSLTLSNYAYSYHMAHGFTIVKSLTFEINSGKSYALADLFKPGSDYIAVLSQSIALQLKQRSLPLLNGFRTIHPNQDYYLADKALVLYFQLYDITPYYVGFPMFPISVYDLLSTAAEPGPISLLAADIA